MRTHTRRTSARGSLRPIAVRLDGASGCYISTPDDNDYTFTNFEIAARVALDDWTPSSTQALCSYLQTDPNRNWRYYVTTAGKLALDWWPTGSAPQRTYESGTTPSFTNGAIYWVKMTFEDNVAGNNRVTHYWAADQQTEPTSWTSLGSGAGGSASFGGFPNVSSILEIGSGQSGGSQRAAGKFYRVIVRNGIGGTVVADFNAADARKPSFTSPVTGELWTLNGTASPVYV